MVIYTGAIVGYDFSITDTFYIVFFIGLFGLSFNRRILTENIWRYVFVIAALMYFHTWIFLPLFLIFSKEIPFLNVFYLLLYSVPLLPLIYALYLYAWRSKKLWQPTDR